MLCPPYIEFITRTFFQPQVRQFWEKNLFTFPDSRSNPSKVKPNTVLFTPIIFPGFHDNLCFLNPPSFSNFVTNHFMGLFFFVFFYIFSFFFGYICPFTLSRRASRNLGPSFTKLYKPKVTCKVLIPILIVSN